MVGSSIHLHQFSNHYNNYIVSSSVLVPKVSVSLICFESSVQIFLTFLYVSVPYSVGTVLFPLTNQQGSICIHLNPASGEVCLLC